MKYYKNLSNGEYKFRTNLLSFILFCILTILFGYIAFKVVAIFYLQSAENALYTVPVRTCLSAKDIQEEYEQVIVYMGDNTLMGNLVPVIETAEVKEPLKEGLMRKIIYCESRNNPEAQNPDSSAYGYCQMINSTWNYIQKKWDMKLDRNNPNDQLYACDRLLLEEGTAHWAESWACWSNI